MNDLSNKPASYIYKLRFICVGFLFGIASLLIPDYLSGQPLINFTKEFTPDTIELNGISTLTFTLENQNEVPYAGVSFVDNFPAGMVVASPANVTNSCFGTFTAVEGSGTVSLTGGTVDVEETCTISVDVTATTIGNLVNTSGDLSAVSNLSAASTRSMMMASATLVVIPPSLDVTLEDDIVHDPNMDMVANPDDSIEYTLTIQNNANQSQTNLEINRSQDPNTTLDPNSITATPVAINDNYDYLSDPLVVNSAMGVLINDADVNDPLPNPPYNTNLTVIEVMGGTVGMAQTTALGGSITMQSDGSFTYDSTGIMGVIPDTVHYKIQDAEGFMDSAIMIIQFEQPPVAQADALTATVNMANNLGANTLFNDNGSGPDNLGSPSADLVNFGGGSLGGTVTDNAAGATVIGTFAGGDLTVNSDGSLIIDNPTMSGMFTFEYRIQNASGFSDATVTVTIQAPPIAVDDAPAMNSSPGDNFHVVINALNAGMGNILTNDNLGFPMATITGYGTSSTPTAVTMGATATNQGGMVTVNGDGTYSYTAPNATFVGLDTFGYQLQNIVGSSTAIVEIAVGNRPTCMNDIYTGTGNIAISVNAMNGLLSNDGGDILTVTEVDRMAANVGNPAMVSGGTLTCNADGSFLFEPDADATFGGFFYTMDNGFGTARECTVSINLTQMIWFINSDSMSAGTGTFTDPFNTVAAFNASAGPSPGDFISLAAGPYSEADGINLQNNQTLIGEGVALSTYFTADGNSIPAYTTFAAAAGTKPVVNTSGGTNHGIDLASGNTIRGVCINNTTGYGMSGGAVGMLVVSDTDIKGMGGGLNIATSGSFDSNVNFGELSSNMSFEHGINLVGVTGNLGLTSGSISGANMVPLKINGGMVSINFPGYSIVHNSNTPTVQIDNGHSTGTISYPGSIMTTNGTGLQFNNADGFQYNFNGAVTLNGGDAGIDIVSGTSGSFTFSNCNIMNPSGDAFNVENSSSSISYLGGSILQTNSSEAVDIANHSIGIITINVPINASTGTANAVDLTSNSNTINFTGSIDMDLVTTTGVAFNATGGGTINLIGASNTITKSGNGVAFNINTSNAGGSGITFNSINVTGGTGTAVDIQNSTGVKNLGDVDVSRAGGGIGILANAGGTINTTAGTIQSGASTAVNISNTIVGMILTSVSSGAGSNVGMTLSSIPSGSFSVVGTGAEGTGGLINMKSNVDGIQLSNTSCSVSLAYMDIQDISHPSDGGDMLNTRRNIDAIHGELVSGGLVLDNCRIQRISDCAINGRQIADGVSPTSWVGLTITNCLIENTNRYHLFNLGDEGDEGGVYMRGLSGNLIVTNSAFGNTCAHLDIGTASSGTFNATIQGNLFNTNIKEFSCNVGTVNIGERGISIMLEGTIGGNIYIGDPMEASAALGNTFTDNATASVVVAGQSAPQHTGNVKVVISRNNFIINDHLTGPDGCPAGTLTFNFPQGGVSLNPAGGLFESIVSNNVFDEVMNAAGGVGQLTLGLNGGNFEGIIRGNTFMLPWNGSVQLIADGNTSAAVLFDNNTYVDGVVGTATDDIGGSTQSPYLGFRVNVRNGGSLDLTMRDDILPQPDDVNGGDTYSFIAEVQNQAGNNLDLYLDNVKSPDGYRLIQSAGAFNLYREIAADLTAQDILDGNGCTGGNGMSGVPNPAVNGDNTSPPILSTSGTITASDTQPTLPMITIP